MRRRLRRCRRRVDPDAIWSATVYKLLAKRSGLPRDAALEAIHPVASFTANGGFDHALSLCGVDGIRAAIAGYRFLEMHEQAEQLEEYLRLATYADIEDRDERQAAEEALDDASHDRIGELELAFDKPGVVLQTAMKAAMHRNRDDFTRMTGGHYALLKSHWED